ncbi:hypothetical protein M501DRAFT_375939 [Patellaria atrata CBS 101060]|uniref:Uncharacterized protein n=1 Tax=Patellaria atrata CBS 101060 TaxID=1346257 RepID=A0A9P4SFM8_9PEZI|nr:hypothetical protein M501DRAFT_375939 [Patellaria atrata CBS 101060]
MRQSNCLNKRSKYLRRDPPGNILNVNKRGVCILSIATKQLRDDASQSRADELEKTVDEVRKRILDPEYFPPEGQETYDAFVSPWSR